MIRYTTDSDPIETGVYACRVLDDCLSGGFCKDIFLMWFDGRWGYMGSDQRYRGEVVGFIGPLERLKVNG